MEGNTHLLQLIRKMRSQIHKLERENRALRGELEVCGQRAGPAEREAARGGGNSTARSLTKVGEEGAASPPAAVQGSIVAGPAPAAEEQTDNAMTVRRYSTSAPAPAPASSRSQQLSKRPPNSGLLDTLGSVQPPVPPAAAQLTPGEGKGLEKPPATCPSNRHSSRMKLFREHVSKCRGKVKAVSFLLPVEKPWYAEKQGALPSPPEQSSSRLTTIAERDL